MAWISGLAHSIFKAAIIKNASVNICEHRLIKKEQERNENFRTEKYSNKNVINGVVYL